MALGQKLKRARELVNLTLEQVAQATRIPTSTLSDFENDRYEPDFAQLVSMARLYRRDFNEFLTEEKLSEPVVMWREEPVEDKAQLRARFLELCDQFYSLELICNSNRASELEELRFELRGLTKQAVEKLAEKTRKELDLGGWPAHNLRRVLEEHAGVKIFVCGLENTDIAACSWGEFGPAVLLPNNVAHWRNNFSLAHELFHLLTWPDDASDDVHFKSTSKLEKLANHFAGCLLVPRKQLVFSVQNRKQNDEFTYPSIIYLAQEFDVSVEALMIRVREVFMLSKKKYEDLLNWAKDNRGAYDSKRMQTLKDEYDRPQRFTKLAFLALDMGRISTGKFAKYMGMSRYKAAKKADERPGDVATTKLATG
ncbi:MAG: XRE family transcriptional regulator [Planctomycetota bacterium]|nr:XRE family transcriptional regulator [Planctomycetota bacterium]